MGFIWLLLTMCGIHCLSRLPKYIAKLEAFTCIKREFAGQKVDSEVGKLMLLIRVVEGGLPSQSVEVEKGFVRLGVLLQTLNRPIDVARDVANAQQAKVVRLSEFPQIRVCDVLRVTVFPENAVKQSRNVRQILPSEERLIFGRVFIVIVPFKLQQRVERFHHILRIDVDQVNPFPMVWIVFVRRYFLHFRWTDIDNREVVQHFEAPFGCPPSASNREDYRSQLFGDFLL
jgi:hypothetical protein